MRTAALAGDRVDRLDKFRTHAKQPGMGKSNNIALPDAGLQVLEDVLVNAVDHRAGLGQEGDLVGALDLAGHHHRLLAVGDVEALLLQRQEDPGLGHVDPKRLERFPHPQTRQSPLLPWREPPRVQSS